MAYFSSEFHVIVNRNREITALGDWGELFMLHLQSEEESN